LAKKGVIKQFLGLWPSSKEMDQWTQKNWMEIIKDKVSYFFYGGGCYVFLFELK
jgi:hypothetical protein